MRLVGSPRVFCWSKAKGIPAALDKLHAQASAKLHADVLDVLTDAGQAVLKKLLPLVQDGKATAKTVNAVFAKLAVGAAIRDAARERIVTTLTAGAAVQLATHKATDVRIKVPEFQTKAAADLPAKVKQGIQRQAAAILGQPYWTDMGENLRKRVVWALARAAEKGQKVETTTQQLTSLLGPDGLAARADNIAATETTGLLNAGAHEARSYLAALGFVEEKQWVARTDGRERPTHRQANGQRVKVDEDFVVGGHACPYPGAVTLPAKERCRCRCWVISV